VRHQSLEIVTQLREELHNRVSELSWRMTELLRQHFGDTVGTPTPKDDESSATDYVKAETPEKPAMLVYQSCRM
jgi:hypothetical protein